MPRPVVVPRIARVADSVATSGRAAESLGASDSHSDPFYASGPSRKHIERMKKRNAGRPSSPPTVGLPPVPPVRPSPPPTVVNPDAGLVSYRNMPAWFAAHVPVSEYRNPKFVGYDAAAGRFADTQRPTCKERPTDNTPKARGKSGGAPRKFIPWCVE